MDVRLRLIAVGWPAIHRFLRRATSSYFISLTSTWMTCLRFGHLNSAGYFIIWKHRYTFRCQKYNWNISHGITTLIWRLHTGKDFFYTFVKYFKSNIRLLQLFWRLDSDAVALYGPWGAGRSFNDRSLLPAVIGNKTKPVAWLVTHCNTSSKRESYVNELRKFIPVDIYGKCNSLHCSNDHECRKFVSINYLWIPETGIFYNL